MTISSVNALVVPPAPEVIDIKSGLYSFRMFIASNTSFIPVGVLGG